MVVERTSQTACQCFDHLAHADYKSLVPARPPVIGEFQMIDLSTQSIVHPSIAVSMSRCEDNAVMSTVEAGSTHRTK